MSMTLASRRELWKLRELVHFLLAGELCYFCKKALSPRADEFVLHGNSTGPAFKDRISIHHLDGDHYNNSESNKALTHEKCHKSHHRREANLARAAKRSADSLDLIGAGELEEPAGKDSKNGD